MELDSGTEGHRTGKAQRCGVIGKPNPLNGIKFKVRDDHNGGILGRAQNLPQAAREGSEHPYLGNVYNTREGALRERPDWI